MAVSAGSRFSGRSKCVTSAIMAPRSRSRWVGMAGVRTNWGVGMNSDALVVAAAIAVAACAMLLGLTLAMWVAGRARAAAAPLLLPAVPAVPLAPSVADGVAPKQLPVLAREL